MTEWQLWKDFASFKGNTSGAMQRRAYSLFPPMLRTIWISEDLSFLEEHVVPKELYEPYRKDDEGGKGRDYNVN